MLLQAKNGSHTQIHYLIRAQMIQYFTQCTKKLSKTCIFMRIEFIMRVLFVQSLSLSLSLGTQCGNNRIFVSPFFCTQMIRHFTR